MLDVLDWRARAKAAGIHLGLSGIVALLAGLVVFGLWFPYPYRSISGGQSLFLLIVVVDLILGPLLTGVVFNRRKPRKELVRDLAVIALLQVSALSYGLWSVYRARPVYLVHEVDRLVVISAADVDPRDLPKALPEFRQLPFRGVRLIGVRESRDGQERLQSMLSALEGKDLSMRPDYWQPLSEANRKSMHDRSKPLALLRDRSDADRAVVDAWLAGQTKKLSELVYLPLVGRGQFWTVVLDASTLEILGYLPIDCF